ncbi:hypothetical protein [Brevundimonas sp.]|uniref:hypothetical protein n=1 Tax=Brevundimonas sp. TaxID=1871086 RepID=UPI0028A023C6|nr:hypothetical protein [Brevundimonas sp.]
MAATLIGTKTEQRMLDGLRGKRMAPAAAAEAVRAFGAETARLDHDHRATSAADNASAAKVVRVKHMGSRAVIALCRDASVARERFGVAGEESGAIWTRTGRSFFNDPAMTEGLLARLRARVDEIGLWDELATNWLLLDSEIMPWSAKAGSLIESQYAPVATSSSEGFRTAREALARAMNRSVDVGAVQARYEDRAMRAGRYATAWAPYVWPVSGIDDLKVAPFHLLASEGRVAQGAGGRAHPHSRSGARRCGAGHRIHRTHRAQDHRRQSAPLVV